MSRELTDFNVRRQSIFLLEKSYGETQQKIDEVEDEKNRLLSINSEIAAQDDLVQQAKDFIMSKFRSFVTVLDYMLAYVILSYYSEFIPFLPVWLKALIAIVIITIIEVVISLFEKENKLPIGQPTSENPFAYDGKYEQSVATYNKNEVRNQKARKVRHMFIVVLPIVSLATMFQEIAAELMMKGMEEDMAYMEPAHNANILFIVFKYLALAACSYGSHYFLTEYSDIIMDAKARMKLEKECETMDDTIQELKERLKQLETTMIKALMDFHQKLRMHIARFGKHDMLPSELFTPMLDKLYLQVNGSRLT